MLSAHKRNRALYVFNTDKASYKKEQPKQQTNSVVVHRGSGGMPFVYNGRVIDSVCCTTNSCIFSLDELVIQVLLDQLQYTATNNFGPTRSSRLNYIFMFSVAAAYNWVTTILSGTKDNWNWDIHYLTNNTMEQYVFVNRAFYAILPTLIPGYDPHMLLVNEQKAMGWTPEEQTNYVNVLTAKTNLAYWISLWQTWYATRQADGFVAAAAQPTTSQLPNGTIKLDVNTTQTISSYPSPSQWTPLFIRNTTTQKYLTWNWQSVRSSCLSESDEVSLESTADAYFPTDRDADIASLVAIVTNLNDTEKVIAEFWAGSPFTVSPPGMFIYFWAMFALSSEFAHTQGMNTFILSGFQLATTLFEAGRVVWRVKKSHMQARPIQDIRSRYAGQTLNSYDGTQIDGSLWIPYQIASFVTPPFADFPSGHSAFGQAFENIMTSWFGPTIPQTKPILLQKMSLISPMFTTNQVQPPGIFVIPKGASEIQPGIVPANDYTLQFLTWGDMADECGYSRQYGGIHAMSAHLGSQALANQLTPLVNSAWGFK
jgi:hypothetical protein